MNVLVVGAGPAGLMAGLKLLEQSRATVNIAEMKEKIGEPQRCAGGVSLEMLNKINVVPPEDAILAHIRRFRIYAPSGKYWELTANEGYGYVLDRTCFEQSLAKKFEMQGGMISRKQVTPSDLDSFQSPSDYIVGADGPNSVVRQWLKIPRLDPKDIHMGVQKTVLMDTFPKDTIEVYFGQKVAPQGYAWIFPRGNNLVRMGLGIPVKIGCQANWLLDAFIARHVVECEDSERIAKTIPTGRMPKTGVYGNTLLAGDALPSTDPLTGGGVVQAMITGSAAGEAIASGDPARYDALIDWLRVQNAKRYRLKSVLTKLKDADLNDLVEAMQSFKPRTASFGSELQRGVRHMLKKKPRLVLKFARRLI